MNKYLICAIFLLAGHLAHSQEYYKPGYFIDNDGVNHKCFIRDLNWQVNPTSFTYRETQEGDEKTGRISNVREFGITDDVIYVRYTGRMDRTGTAPNEPAKGKEPVYDSVEVFLKLLIDGGASLYSFDDLTATTYLYQNGNGGIIQLVNKYYSSEIGTETYELFRKQLSEEVNCKSKQDKKIENIRYRRDDMIDYFVFHNKCRKTDYFIAIQQEAVAPEKTVSLNFRGGLNQGSLLFDQVIGNSYDIDFGDRSSARIGLELETSLPVLRRNLTLIAEFAYTGYEQEKFTNQTIGANAVLASARYRAINFAVGTRYYVRVSDNFKLYINGSVQAFSSSGSYVDIPSVADELPVSNPIATNWGGGIYLGDRLYLEYKRNATVDWFGNNGDYSSEYRSHSFVFGLMIWKKTVSDQPED